MTSTSSAIELLLEGHRICGRYQLQQFLHGSSHLQIWQVGDFSGRRYVAKLTPLASDSSPRRSYVAETNVFFSLTYNRIRSHRTVDVATPSGFPNIFFFGRHRNQYDVIVVELLYADIYNIRNRGRWRTLATTTGYLMILDQMIMALMTLHQHGFVHRNVKPHNVRISNDSLAVLHNFSVSKRFVDLVTGYHVPLGREQIFIGTLKYASLNAHRMLTQSRRDDLISLGYSIIDVMKRGLPWDTGSRGLRPIAETAHFVVQAKRNTSLESLCHGLPNGILRYMQIVVGLFYYDTPDYNLLRALVRTDQT